MCLQSKHRSGGGDTVMVGWEFGRSWHGKREGVVRLRLLQKWAGASAG